MHSHLLSVVLLIDVQTTIDPSALRPNADDATLTNLSFSIIGYW